MPDINTLIENDLSTELSATQWYAAIIGESPSKGARSPLLWNAAFSRMEVDARMHPMDVLPDKLGSVINALKEDRHFIGGAVAVPYKEAVLKYLDTLEKEAEIIGAVNCIYRDQKGLKGANTDGAGALAALESVIGAGKLAGSRVVVLGLGGAGLAVAAYVATAIGEKGHLVLSNRTRSKAEELQRRLHNECSVSVGNWPVSTGDLEGTDVLINCTSVGFEGLKESDNGVYTLRMFAPLGPLPDMYLESTGSDLLHRYYERAQAPIQQNIQHTMQTLAEMKNTVVFDIIYQPRQTLLLHLADVYGLPTLNGEAMNLEQAVIAFAKACQILKPSIADPSSVRECMQTVA